MNFLKRNWFEMLVVLSITVGSSVFVYLLFSTMHDYKVLERRLATANACQPIEEGDSATLTIHKGEYECAIAGKRRKGVRTIIWRNT